MKTTWRRAPRRAIARATRGIDASAKSSWNDAHRDSNFGRKYSLRQEEVELDSGTATAGKLKAYLTEERRKEGAPRSSSAVIFVPDVMGWNNARTRRLADHLAVFCACMVLVPDLSRSLVPDKNLQAGPVLEQWLSGQPPARVSNDLRTCAVYLRADYRVSRLGVVGVGLGGGRAIEELAGGVALGASVGAVICPSRYDAELFGSIRVPILCIYGDEAAAAASEAKRLLGCLPAAEEVLESKPIEAVPSLSALKRMRVAELRSRLTSLGLDASGTKPQLAERLRNAMLQNSEPAVPFAPNGQPAATSSKHMVLQCDGAESICDMAEARSSVKAAAEEEMQMEDAAEGDAERDAGEADVVLLVEGWFNAHFKRLQIEQLANDDRESDAESVYEM